MIRIWVLAGLLCALSGAARAEPFARSTEKMDLDGREVSVDVYRPTAVGIDGVAVLAHGFTRARHRHRDLARALAAGGIVAVVPDLPHVVDHWGNGDAIDELVRKLEAGAVGLAPVDRSRLVLVGTSAGGLATVLAAAKLPGIAGWVGLDPVDRTGTGVQAAAQLASPAIVLLAEPSGCNLFGSGRSIARAAPFLIRSVVLDGASHCDFEGPTSKLCRVLCGESSSGMQALAREETVKAVAELLPGPAGHREPAVDAAADAHD